MTDSKIAEKILLSLNPRFDWVLVSIGEAKDLTLLSIEEFMGSLRVHEQPLNRLVDCTYLSMYLNQVIINDSKNKRKNLHHIEVEEEEDQKA